jgi:aerobic-type carbon monoxide dehydrogenase small subunit (CoxS/CutS family)
MRACARNGCFAHGRVANLSPFHAEEVCMTALKINDQSRTTSSPEETPLLWVLRDELGLTGTKFGCGMALCGACTVHVDGQTERSC